MADRLTICNNALSELASDPMNSLEEASLQAQYCGRLFPQVFSEMLTWTEWDFVIRRVLLAQQALDRLGEWTYRYAKPADMAEAIRVLPKLDNIPVALPAIGPFTFPAWDALGKFPFLISGGSIYANVENAILEYQANEVEVALVDPLTARAIELELAVRLAMPLKKDRAIKGDLIKQAEIARQRAVAESENRNPRQQTDYVSPVEYARSGMMDGTGYGL